MLPRVQNFDVGGGKGMVWTPDPLVIFHVILFTKIIQRRDWFDDMRLLF